MPKIKNFGILIISLDLEEYWGFKDKISIRDFKKRFNGGSLVIPHILNLFKIYGIHATWATTGCLFFDNYYDLINNLPELKPKYLDKKLSDYLYFNNNDINDIDQSLLFMPQQILSISKEPHQEIGTHTFSHYYCLEPGQTKEQFKADIQAAKKIAKKYDIQIKSIVFPRNQINIDYLKVCSELGINSYRGNQDKWIYKRLSKTSTNNIFFKRLYLLDDYFNIFGFDNFKYNEIGKNIPINIRSSRCLRKYQNNFKTLEYIRLNSIKRDLTRAARDNLIYHLYWHPHDFGKNIEPNIIFLNNILIHYQELNLKYGMKSFNFNELYNFVINN